MGGIGTSHWSHCPSDCNRLLQGEGRAAFGVSEMVLGQRLPDLHLMFRDEQGHVLSALPGALHPATVHLRAEPAAGASQLAPDHGLVLRCDQASPPGLSNPRSGGFHWRGCREGAPLMWVACALSDGPLQGRELETIACVTFTSLVKADSSVSGR